MQPTCSPAEALPAATGRRRRWAPWTTDWYAKQRWRGHGPDGSVWEMTAEGLCPPAVDGCRSTSFPGAAGFGPGHGQIGQMWC